MNIEPLRFPWMRARRRAFFGLVAATTGAGVWMMVHIVGGGGFTILEVAILALFTPTFAWITIPFWTAVTGFLLHLLRRDPNTLQPMETVDARRTARPSPPVGRTAVVIPVRNEDAEAVAARVSAMVSSLGRAGAGGAFHVHLLSDTSDIEIAAAEEFAWVQLQARHPGVPILYRRRERNTGRKAGNVWEFCTRCVDQYDYMVVLDADSLMTGAALVTMALEMDASPDVGLIQSVPLPARQRTLFGRLVQFAGCLYGPMLAAGQSFWQGGSANYWGHNAIVRLRPFVEHCALPTLRGRPPLGGEVLSHDFVEAALMRRAGWKVVLDARLAGSWEEVPGTVADFARRDRRWAQGSLQHLRLLATPGLHGLSRLHFLLGAMGYISSPLWLLFLVFGSVYVLLPDVHGPSILAGPGPLPVGLSLLAVTAVLLFLPKALALALRMGTTSADFGGRASLLAGSLVETVFSVLLAPLMMVYHTRFVTSIALGRSVEWGAGPRDGAVPTWRESVRAGAAPTVLGIVWGSATLWASPLFFLWMSPIFLGLLLSVPLLRLTASPTLGRRASGIGLLTVPSEARLVQEIEAVEADLSQGSGSGHEDPSGVPGVLSAPGSTVPPSSHTSGRSMHQAQRGLFDLRQGRPFLVTDLRSPGSPASAILIAAVDELDERSLAELRALAPAEPRLLLTRHRVDAIGITPPGGDAATETSYAIGLGQAPAVKYIGALACGPVSGVDFGHPEVETTTRPEAAAMGLVRLGRLLPAVVSVPVAAPFEPRLQEALDRAAVLSADAADVLHFIEATRDGIVQVGEAPVPLPGAEDSRFVLFREASGLQEHVAIVVGDPDRWPDPVPVRLHSACLTGDLFGSLRCDCGEQLESAMDIFSARGGGVLLYLAQEGRGIGLRNKFRAYTLQGHGMDTIDADGALGFGPDERRYGMAARMLESLGVRRIELLTNNPDKVRAMIEEGIVVARRHPLHGTLNRHNLPYVRTKVQRAGHWLGTMLSQPLSGTEG